MTDLSPAAQAVLDAANSRNSYGPDDCLNESRWISAATLRAAAEQVLPLDDDPEFFPGNCCERVLKQEQQETRNALLGIATELEAL